MNTDARRKAAAIYHAKREAGGLKKVTLWLSPEARTRLESLKKTSGSKDKAANDAILAWLVPPSATIHAQSPAGPEERPIVSARAEAWADAIVKENASLVQIGPTVRKPGSLLKGPKK